MFVDHIRIHAKAGDGGDGARSFRRETFVPKGGPDGGDGGKGGDVVFRADANVDTLATFFYEPHVRAKDGERGGGKKMSGKAGPDKVVPVPMGTLIYRLPANSPLAAVEAGEEDEEEYSPERHGRAGDPVPRPPLQPPREVAPEELELIADLTELGQTALLCKGGNGGRGNVHFKSSRNQAPTRADSGTPGEEAYYYLELRKIADAGLVGYPNAGKSTLLGAISAAKPKIAAYPFTTLHPSVGVVERAGFRRFTVADIPGIIEGAHENVGLGHEFLRHIVRCKILVFVLDMAGSEGRNPLQDLAHLRREIDLYDPTLSGRPWIIVANKMDLPEAKENLKVLRRDFPKIKVFGISAQGRVDLEPLLLNLEQRIFGQTA